LTIFFHHVGEVGAARDSPRTIFDESTGSGLRLFRGDYILPELSDLPESVAEAIRRVPNGFQIWGIPSGGLRLFRRIAEDDYLLLIDTDRPGGSISYGGKVVCKIENPSFRLSNYLWGEAKFPLIGLLDGFRTYLEVTEFKEMFDYSPNWSMRGFAYSLAEPRIRESQFGTERAFVDYLIAQGPAGSTPGVLGLDEPPPDDFVIEGGLALAVHLSRERDRTLIARFKDSLKAFDCCVCGFDFEKTYGKLGKEFIEAHHVQPLGRGGERETRIADLRPVCSNCHRMLHRGLGMSIEDLQKMLRRNQP